MIQMGEGIVSSAPEAAATHFASGKPPVYDFSLPQFHCGGKGKGGG